MDADEMRRCESAHRIHSQSAQYSDGTSGHIWKDSFETWNRTFDAVLLAFLMCESGSCRAADTRSWTIQCMERCDIQWNRMCWELKEPVLVQWKCCYSSVIRYAHCVDRRCLHNIVWHSIQMKWWLMHLFSIDLSSERCAHGIMQRKKNATPERVLRPTVLCWRAHSFVLLRCDRQVVASNSQVIRFVSHFDLFATAIRVAIEPRKMDLYRQKNGNNRLLDAQTKDPWNWTRSFARWHLLDTSPHYYILSSISLSILLSLSLFFSLNFHLFIPFLFFFLLYAECEQWTIGNDVRSCE